MRSSGSGEVFVCSSDSNIVPVMFFYRLLTRRACVRSSSVRIAPLRRTYTISLRAQMGATNTFRSTYKGNPRLTGAGVLSRNTPCDSYKAFKHDSWTRSQITYTLTHQSAEYQYGFPVVPMYFAKHGDSGA